MNRSVITLGSLFTAGAFGAGALLLVACAGRVQSGESTQAQLQPVSMGEVSGPVVACGGGFAHPNVCCEAGPSTTSACGVYQDAPFQSCGDGYTTYPDPRSCCPLDGNGECAAPPPSSPPLPPDGCGYACPLGQYEPQGQPGTCCGTDPSGASFCSGGGFAGGGSGVTGCGCACPACPAGETCPPCDCNCSPPPPPPPTTCSVCACPACEPGQTCPPCDCPPPQPCPPPPQCGSCPPGWQAPEGAPYLCCTEQSGGIIDCFSQGVPPSPTPVGIDAGAPVPVMGAGASSSP